MDKQIFSLFDDGLTETRAAVCQLQAIFGVDGVSLLINHQEYESMAIAAWHISPVKPHFDAAMSDIRQVLGQESKFRWPFQAVRVGFSNKEVTLVPRRLFREDALSAYFQLLLPAHDYTYAFEELPALDCYLVYAIEKSMLQLVQQYFPAGKMTHLATTLLRNWQKEASETDHTVMVNLRNECLQIAVFERRNLLFFNTFNFATAHDVLYHVLLVYDQFRLNPLETPLCLSGSLLEDSEIYRTLFRYIRHLQFMKLPKGYQLPYKSAALPPHCYFDLYTLCAL
jgi:hypothetical protein